MLRPTGRPHLSEKNVSGVWLFTLDNVTILSGCLPVHIRDTRGVQDDRALWEGYKLKNDHTSQLTPVLLSIPVNESVTSSNITGVRTK